MLNSARSSSQRQMRSFRQEQSGAGDFIDRDRVLTNMSTEDICMKRRRLTSSARAELIQFGVSSRVEVDYNTDQRRLVLRDSTRDDGAIRFFESLYVIT